MSVTAALAAGTEAAVIAWGDFEPGDLPRPKANKTLAACIDALWSYNERWPFDTDRLQPYRLPDGSPAIEQSFAFPIEGTIHPITGNPIIYAGRFDMVGVWDKEAVFICDEKTSTSLGKSWRSNWPLRGQITGYIKGWNQYAPRPAKDAIIRGLGILQGEITTEEVFTTRPDWMVDQWSKQLCRDVNRAIDAWCDMAKSDGEHRDAWDQSFDNACSAYSGCAFTELCSSEYPERWLGEFDVSPWDPLRRNVE